MRQVDPAARRRRPGRADQRRRRGVRHVAAGGAAQALARLRVPGRGAAALAHRAAERRAAARGRRAGAPAGRRADAARAAQARRARRLGSTASRTNFGRHAPARLDRPRAARRAAAAADGRAVRRARRDHARPAERGAAPHLAGDRHHDPVRHPLGLRGDVPRRAGAGAGGQSRPRARARADRPAGATATSRSARPSRSCSIARAGCADAAGRGAHERDQRSSPPSMLLGRRGRGSRVSCAQQAARDVAPPPAAGGRHRAALCVWAALVYIFKVPPFIAPSPLLVVATLYAKFGAADGQSAADRHRGDLAASCSAISPRS